MIAYKASYNHICRDIPITIGKYYEIKSSNKNLYTDSLLHFCPDIKNIFNYYPYIKWKIKIYKIEVLGRIVYDYDEAGTDKLRIIEEVPYQIYSKDMPNYEFNRYRNLVYFKYTDGFFIKYKYNKKGMLVEEEYSNGLVNYYSYKNNLLISNYNNIGYCLKNEYVDNLLTYEYDNFGYWKKYYYENRKLIKTEDYKNNTKEYSYNNGKIVKKTKKDGEGKVFIEYYEYYKNLLYKKYDSDNVYILYYYDRNGMMSEKITKNSFLKIY